LLNPPQSPFVKGGRCNGNAALDVAKEGSMSDRIFGLIWLAVSVTIGALAWRIHAPF
jgi:hypothetical protein